MAKTNTTMSKKKRVAVWVVLLALPWVLIILLMIPRAIIVQRSTDSLMDDCPTISAEEAERLIQENGELPAVRSCGLYQDDRPAAYYLINIATVLLGVIGLLGAPICIIMIVRASDYNKKL